MDMQGGVTIDLGKYGAEGQITLAPPTFRRQNEFSNAIGSVRVDENGKAIPMNLRLGDLSVMQVLVYVKSAPFGIALSDVTPFLDFCDMLDEKRNGSATELWVEMNDVIKSFEDRSTHPFAVSGAFPTTTSD